MQNKLSTLLLSLLSFSLIACGTASEPDSASEADVNKRTFMVKLTYCDGRVDTVVINTYDGEAPNSGYIRTRDEAYPVYRGSNFAFINVCDLEVTSEKNAQKEGTPIIQQAK